MQTLEYTTIDKSSWGIGPWQTEPDKRQWMDNATGYPCLIVRGPSGALCGYVGVPDGHPAFKKEYDDVDVSVHGGLTFSSFCQPVDDESEGICHAVEPGEKDRVWWFGFDCAHSMDFMPAYEEVCSHPLFPLMVGFDMVGSILGVYRDINYVTEEVERLAIQLKAIAKKGYKMEDFKDLPKTRSEALKHGSKHYFTGKPCKNGHIDYRYTSSRCCKGCVKQSQIKWRIDNPIKYRHYQRQFQRKYAKKRREKNKLMKQQLAAYIEKYGAL